MMIAVVVALSVDTVLISSNTILASAPSSQPMDVNLRVRARNVSTVLLSDNTVLLSVHTVLATVTSVDGALISDTAM